MKNVDEKVAVSPSRPLNCSPARLLPEPYYSDGSITIYNADCAQILPFLEPCDLLLTDPPYGLKESHKANKRATDNATRGGFGNIRPTHFEMSDWDKQTPPEWIFGLLLQKANFQIIFGGNFFHLPPSKCWLVWDKDNAGTDFADCELAWTNLKCAVRKFKWRWNGMLQENMQNKETRFHPTQKPLAVMKWCLSLVPDAKTVLDPFMGSGTTLRAAKDLGLQAVGIEKDERYCEIAADRLKQQTLGF